jgi:hypothetical protein
LHHRPDGLRCFGTAVEATGGIVTASADATMIVMSVIAAA